MQQAIIDSHAHVFKRNLPLASVRRYAPDYDATLTEYLELLDRHHICHGVLVQPSFLGTNNDYMLQALHESAGRCVGVAVVSPDCSIEELLALRDSNVRGIRLNLFGTEGIDLQQDTWQQLFFRLKALDMHVELHAPMASLADHIPPLIAHDVDLVVDHFGRPALRKPVSQARAAQESGVQTGGIQTDGLRQAVLQEDAQHDTLFDADQFDFLFSLRNSDHLFIKLSAIYRLFDNVQTDKVKALLARFLDTFSSKKLMWGSDWPHTQFESSSNFNDSLAWALQYIDQPVDRHNIFYNTAASFYKIQGDKV